VNNGPVGGLRRAELSQAHNEWQEGWTRHTMGLAGGSAFNNRQTISGVVPAIGSKGANPAFNSPPYYFHPA
jgi:hypothetical protein